MLKVKLWQQRNAAVSRRPLSVKSQSSIYKDGKYFKRVTGLSPREYRNRV